MVDPVTTDPKGEARVNARATTLATRRLLSSKSQVMLVQPMG